jgi:hypothetical protein
MNVEIILGITIPIVLFTTAIVIKIRDKKKSTHRKNKFICQATLTTRKKTIIFNKK